MTPHGLSHKPTDWEPAANTVANLRRRYVYTPGCNDLRAVTSPGIRLLAGSGYHGDAGQLQNSFRMPPSLEVGPCVGSGQQHQRRARVPAGKRFQRIYSER